MNPPFNLSFLKGKVNNKAIHCPVNADYPVLFSLSVKDLLNSPYVKPEYPIFVFLTQITKTQGG
jgi:hypothetical protein